MIFSAGCHELQLGLCNIDIKTSLTVLLYRRRKFNLTGNRMILKIFYKIHHGLQICSVRSLSGYFLRLLCSLLYSNLVAELMLLAFC